MARLTFLLMPLAFISISKYTNSQGIGGDVITGGGGGGIGGGVETNANIDANIIHNLGKQLDSKVETQNTRVDLNKVAIDEQFIRTLIDSLSKDLSKEEHRYLVQELQRAVESLPRRRIARQTNPVKTNIITYRLGKRATGDRLLATLSVNEQWNAAQNVSHTLTYPRIGVGSVLTYVEVIVEQTSNLGGASAPTGGIGQRFISIIIEAKNTLQYRATAAIYGY